MITLPKPFAMQELVARVCAPGRRFAEEPALSLAESGDLTFDLANHEVFRGVGPNRFSTRELMLLKVLMREPAASLPALNYASAFGNTTTNTIPN